MTVAFGSGQLKTFPLHQRLIIFQLDFVFVALISTGSVVQENAHKGTQMNNKIAEKRQHKLMLIIS